AMILVHNHPSGEPTPSLDDRRVTFQLVQAGDLMGIPIADHVIVGEGRYFSFKESNELRTGLGRAAKPVLMAA
ncbi:MAG TPA: JAB domain-containing protein, partial [Longimicrobium sp.]